MHLLNRDPITGRMSKVVGKPPKMLAMEKVLNTTFKEDYLKYYIGQNWTNVDFAKRWHTNNNSIFSSYSQKGNRRSWLDWDENLKKLPRKLSKKRSKWTVEEIEFVKNNLNLSTKEIALKLGKSCKAIWKYKSKKNIGSHVKRTLWSDKEIEYLGKYGANKSNKKLAKKLNKRAKVVEYQCRKQKINEEWLSEFF